MVADGGYDNEAPRSLSGCCSPATEFMAEAPMRPKGRGLQAPRLSMFEWALRLEQEREEEIVGAGR